MEFKHPCFVPVAMASSSNVWVLQGFLSHSADLMYDTLRDTPIDWIDHEWRKNLKVCFWSADVGATYSYADLKTAAPVEMVERTAAMLSALAKNASVSYTNCCNGNRFERKNERYCNSLGRHEDDEPEHTHNLIASVSVGASADFSLYIKGKWRTIRINHGDVVFFDRFTTHRVDRIYYTTTHPYRCRMFISRLP